MAARYLNEKCYNIWTALIIENGKPSLTPPLKFISSVWLRARAKDLGRQFWMLMRYNVLTSTCGGKGAQKPAQANVRETWLCAAAWRMRASSITAESKPPVFSKKKLPFSKHDDGHFVRAREVRWGGGLLLEKVAVTCRLGKKAMLIQAPSTGLQLQCMRLGDRWNMGKPM